MLLETDVGQPTALNRPTITLLREFIETLKLRESTVVLQWPFGQRDVSLLHPLAMIALICAPPQKTAGGLTWCDPSPDFRTLYYPWRGGATSAIQRSHLVHRDEIIRWNSFHLTRLHANAAANPALVDKLHITLGHLGRLSQRDATKPHLAHPTLAEIYPTFVAEGEPASRPFDRAADELFGRVRYGAALDRMTDYRPALCLSHTAPFGFFAVSPRAELRRALAARALVTAVGRSPDICLLDLGPPALSRLGPNWSETVEGFVSEAKKRFPGMPFFVATQDPFVHRRVTSMLGVLLASKAVRSRVVVRVSRDPLSQDPTIESVSKTTARFSTVSGPISDAMLALSDAARGSSDPALAGTLRREMGSLRKAASLPCGLAPTYDFLCQEIGQSATETFLEYRSRGTLLAPLEDALRSEIGGAERARLLQARDAVSRAFDALDAETPIGSLFGALAATLARKSSRALIAFASDVDRLLGRSRLISDPNVGAALTRRIEKGHLRLASVDDLEACLSDIELTRDRNSWMRLVIVAPSLEWLSTIVARAWLPEEIIVVCERHLAARVADTFERLSSHPDLAGIGKLGGRLLQIAGAAKAEVEARQVASIELELEPRLESSSAEAVIDLIDDDADDSTDLILMRLVSGRTLRARQGSAIIRYNKYAEINPYERAYARQIQKGESVIVPDQAFLAETREILPVRVLAQSWVEIYHSTVAAQLASIPGNTLSAKAHAVLEGIRRDGGRTQTHAAVLDWLKVEEHRRVDPEKRQPHAPQRRREFDAFMRVLGVNELLAEKMWIEGIQPLRIDRRRAGLRMAQAFVSVLVDPHGTASGFDPSVRAAIAKLREKALDYLDQVMDVETIHRGGVL